MHEGRLALEYARFLNDNMQGLPKKEEFFNYIKKHNIVEYWEIAQARSAFENFEVEIRVVNNADIMD